jgi:hypothetical protein
VLKQDLFGELLCFNCEATFLVIGEPTLADLDWALPMLVDPTTMRVIERELAFYYLRCHGILA